MKNKLSKIKNNNMIFIEQSKIILLDDIYNTTPDLLLDENIIEEIKENIIEETKENIVEEIKENIIEEEIYDAYSDYYTSDDDYNKPVKNKKPELKVNNNVITKQTQQKNIVNNINIIKRNRYR